MIVTTRSAPALEDDGLRAPRERDDEAHRTLGAHPCEDGSEVVRLRVLA